MGGINPVIDHDLQCVYIMIPKCACSTIRNLIMKCQRKSNDVPYLHGALQCMKRVKPKEAAQYQDYFWFSFLRHPIDRFLSAFKDKYLRDGPDQRWYRFAERSLDQMIDYIQGDDDVIDIHFRSQFWYLNRCQHVHVDFLGTVEHFDRDIQLVKDRLGILYDHEHFRQTSIKVELTEQQEAQILDRYAKDLLLWKAMQ